MMTSKRGTYLNSLLVGDELGQIKLVQLIKHKKSDPDDEYKSRRSRNLARLHMTNEELESRLRYLTVNNHLISHHNYRIIRILDDCLQKEPAVSRAVTNIRPIENVYQSCLDTTEKPNNLFLIANKVGQMFVCDTDAVRRRYLFNIHGEEFLDNSDDENETPHLSPIYYNMNNKAPVLGGQPINQANILVVYRNGDIQHVRIGQDILQSSLRIRRKAIKTLGLGYNCDSKAIHWRIDGSSGICYVDTDGATAHMDENDPLTDIVLSSPIHKLSKKRNDRSQHNLYHQSPCIKSRKYNEQDRLIPTQVINMITSRTDQYKPSSNICRWSSITSLNLIYRKLALYDLVGSENFEKCQVQPNYSVSCYKLNDNRLAIGGHKYALRVFDVPTQQVIYNSRTGDRKNPLACPSKGEPVMVSDIDWLGGNKTTKKSPYLIATCSGIDSIVEVYDLRSPRPVFHIDLTQETENKWQPYENHPKGCMFTSICASGASYSTAVPSQQLALGSTNGQLHVIDLRFMAKSHRILGKLSGFCGGSVREMRFVSESFDTSRMVSCASDRFIRVHKIQTSFNSVISQKLATKVFLGSKPTSIQPICDEMAYGFSSSISRCESESRISSVGSGGWAML